MQHQADLVIRNGNIATLVGPEEPRQAEAANDIGLQKGWTIASTGHRITWMGPDADWNGKARQEIDATGRFVTPGYVDAHTHLVYAGDRAFEMAMKLAGSSYLDILAAGGGIAHTTTHTRQATLDELVAQARPRLRRMLQNGTTALEAKSGYALETEGELRMLEAGDRLRSETGMTLVNTFLGAHAVPDEYAGRTREYVRVIVDQMLPAVAKQGIAHFCDVFVEEGVFTYAHGQQILEAAKSLGLGIRLHADEIVNTKGAQLAAEMGCICADHLLQISESGIQAMAEAGTIATLLPTVPVTLMKPEWPPARRMLEAGIPIALGSDHNPNNPVTDMGLVCQLACYLLRLTPAQALTGATWNSACTLALESEIGSLEPGKRADILVHDIEDLDHWAYEVGRRTVRYVVLGGAIQA